MGVEVAFEQDDGGEAVDGLGALLRADAAFPENAGGFAGGEALVPQPYIDAGAGVESFGELDGAGGAGAFASAHVEGIAGDDQANSELLDEPGESVEVGAEVLALERREALSRNTEFIADG